MSLKRVAHPSERLEILGRVIRVAQSIPDVEAVLEVLMDHLIELVGAERGFIMLVDAQTGELEFRKARNFSREEVFEGDYHVSRSIVYEVFQSGKPVLTDDAQADARFARARSIQIFQLRAVICAPLRTSQRTLGVLYADNRIRDGAFFTDDLAFLETFADQAASVLERVQLAEDRNRIRDRFACYTSPEVVDEILSRPDEALRAVRREVTVMFADLRGFSMMAEGTEPDQLLGTLNRYFEAMSRVIFARSGTILGYLGDGLLVVFGAPLDVDWKEACAVECAREMVREAAALNLAVGVGLATGEAVVGDLGASRNRAYTVIGDVVNTAARLEKLTKEKQCSILCDDDTYRAGLGEGGRDIGEVQLRGKSRPVPVWAV